ncbi:MAG: hypothetical protein ACLFUS_14555 [Candidatus Sumerlaeia bacterium]
MQKNDCMDDGMLRRQKMETIGKKEVIEILKELDKDVDTKAVMAVVDRCRNMIQANPSGIGVLEVVLDCINMHLKRMEGKRQNYLNRLPAEIGPELMEEITEILDFNK